MARWFRFHTDALNNPKVQKLDGETFKQWVNILCIVADNEGKLPPMADLAFALRITEDGAQTVVERLLNATLIDRLSGGANGAHYAAHGWDERQYKSDTSTDRVKRFRERSKPVTVTPPDTDTDTEVSVAKATGAAAPSDKQFWDHAKLFIGGKNPGALIGKWNRDYGQDNTARAITEAQLNRAVDPVPYVERVLRKAKSGSEELPIC